MPAFALSHLDHVAIHATDPYASVAWYERVLGLQKMQLKEWGEFPIFMLSGQVGVAIFKANPNAGTPNPKRGSVRIDHFAFNVTKDDFTRAHKIGKHNGQYYALVQRDEGEKKYTGNEGKVKGQRLY